MSAEIRKGPVALGFGLLAIRDRCGGVSFTRTVRGAQFYAGLEACERPCAADEWADIDEAEAVEEE